MVRARPSEGRITGRTADQTGGVRVGVLAGEPLPGVVAEADLAGAGIDVGVAGELGLDARGLALGVALRSKDRLRGLSSESRHRTIHRLPWP
ncbi:MAG: hypothetical protein L0I24_02485 [Pseudonocardia sp.]|nr:hypothetical protein [Pseudonocardia sp.]